MGRTEIVELKNLGRKMESVLKRAAQHNAQVTAEALTNMPYALEKAALDFYPTVLRVRSDKLKGSIRGFSTGSGERVTIGLRSRNVVYARIQHWGGKTKPHTILPRRKKALYWAGAKHPVKSVKHPGSRIRATLFFSKPILKTVPKLLGELKDFIGFGD